MKIKDWQRKLIAFEMANQIMDRLDRTSLPQSVHDAIRAYVHGICDLVEKETKNENQDYQRNSI